ncbi:hypothetical protein ACU61A_09425 [Pseudonocardia sichuanensis]
MAEASSASTRVDLPLPFPPTTNVAASGNARSPSSAILALDLVEPDQRGRAQRGVFGGAHRVGGHEPLAALGSDALQAHAQHSPLVAQRLESVGVVEQVARVRR